MIALNIENIKDKPNSDAKLEINGNSNILQIQEMTGNIRINGNETCIYLAGELQQHSEAEEHITFNDLIYQLVEVVELLIILLIFYVIFSNVAY